jgi:hypothetical protein
MSVLELARQQWEEGYRRMQRESADRALQARLLRQVEIVLEELRRRVGGSYTLSELAHAYRDAERWAHEAIAETEPPPGWPRWVSTATDAAFHRYARGAQDYRP